MKKILHFVEEKQLKNFHIVHFILMIVYQPKGKKEDVAIKDDEDSSFFEKKVKSANISKI